MPLNGTAAGTGAGRGWRDTRARVWLSVGTAVAERAAASNGAQQGGELAQSSGERGCGGALGVERRGGKRRGEVAL